MRRAMTILVLGMLLLALFVSGAVAATGCASIFSGTDGPDTLKGDRCDNNISGLRGNDAIYGFRGDDDLFGNQGNDLLRGGSGNDRIHSGGLDGKRDRVVCGSGRDFASIAENDFAAEDCEVVAVSIG